MKKIMKIDVLALCLSLSMAPAIGANEQMTDPMHLPTRNGSLWYRYYAAGEQAFTKKHDEGLAKRYWLASLTSLENEPYEKATQDMMILVRLSALEDRIIHLYEPYPDDDPRSVEINSWLKKSRSEEPQIQNDKAQLALLKQKARVLKRIADLNAKFVRKPSDPFATVWQGYYQKAEQDCKKLQEKIESSN